MCFPFRNFHVEPSRRNRFCLHQSVFAPPRNTQCQCEYFSCRNCKFHGFRFRVVRFLMDYCIGYGKCRISVKVDGNAIRCFEINSIGQFKHHPAQIVRAAIGLMFIPFTRLIERNEVTLAEAVFGLRSKKRIVHHPFVQIAQPRIGIEFQIFCRATEQIG